MRQLEITYTVDSDYMTDEEYENQEEKTFVLSFADLERLIKCGTIFKDPKLELEEYVSHIISIKEINTNE